MKLVEATVANGGREFTLASTSMTATGAEATDIHGVGGEIKAGVAEVLEAAMVG